MDYSQRIRSKKDFDRVYQRGKRISGRFYVLLWIPNELGKNRYGIVASKRVGKAVGRNRARRRLREIVRIVDEKMLQGYDLVIVARQGVLEVSFAELLRDCEKILKKVGLLVG